MALPRGLLAPACDEYLYRDLGFEEHPSCRGNLASTLGRFGFEPDRLEESFLGLFIVEDIQTGVSKLHPSFNIVR